MIHRLTLGHLDPEGVRQGQRVVLKRLDMSLVAKLLHDFGEIDADGLTRLGGFPVQCHEGYVVCRWLMPGRIHQTGQFARRLATETGCLITDFTNRRVISIEALAEAAETTPITDRPELRKL
jgi:hypothetical protein